MTCVTALAWEVTKTNDNKAVPLSDGTHQEGIQNVMPSPKFQEWNSANNAVAYFLCA